MKHLVEASTGFAWHLVDAGGYASIVNWFTCNCHADVVLDDPVSDYHELDTRILRLAIVVPSFTLGNSCVLIVYWREADFNITYIYITW